jgi:ferritin-like metal-binding protein YciE
MKKSLLTLQDALAHLLNEFYAAEQKIQQTVSDCSMHISSPALKREIEKYGESSQDKITKLERCFNYLMEEPRPHDNEAMNIMLENVFQTITHTSESLRDAMIIHCFQQVCHLQIAGYGTARAMALEMELEVVGDLLTEILVWEKETDRTLTRIALSETNLKAAEPKNLINT